MLGKNKGIIVILLFYQRIHQNSFTSTIIFKLKLRKVTSLMKLRAPPMEANTLNGCSTNKMIHINKEMLRLLFM